MYIIIHKLWYVHTCVIIIITIIILANERSNVIIIARKEGGAWERIIINAPQAVDRSEGWGTAEVDGAGPSAMVEKDEYSFMVLKVTEMHQKRPRTIQ